MQLTIVAVDKLRERYLRDGCAAYVAKLAKHMPVRTVEIKPAVSKVEARAMLSHVDSESLVWALDREGESLTSPELARRLARAQRSGRRRLTLLIGGPDGLHPDALARADFRWSLSPLTFLHEMARLIALEQLYRALKINRGERYHR